ncbi:MAG: hypothetical protein P8166_03355 [Candidatus Thiodiazotropha sp.]
MAKDKRLVLDAGMDMTENALSGNDVWIDLDGDSIGDDTWEAHRVNMSLDSWSSGWNAAINAFVDQSCRQVYEPLGRLDRCSYKGTLLWLMNGAVPFIETPTFIRLDLEDNTASKRWTGPWPTGENLMIGQFGCATTIDDFTTIARESLIQIFTAPGRPVSALFSPRCAAHVGLESSSVFPTHTTPDTAYLFGNWFNVGGLRSLHDALWEWYLTAGPLRYVDTADVNDPTIANNPIIDPVTQFSAGMGCRY